MAFSRGRQNRVTISAASTWWRSLVLLLSLVIVIESFVLPVQVSRHYCEQQRKGLAMSSGKNQGSKRAALFPFKEARKIARGHGFESQQEFVDYSCPGAYQLPKNADEVWKEDWKGWDDFLGIPLEFQEARKVARKLNLTSGHEYLTLMESKTLDDDDLASRLPYRPDLKYKQEWVSWEDWLGTA